MFFMMVSSAPRAAEPGSSFSMEVLQTLLHVLRQAGGRAADQFEDFIGQFTHGFS
jgi:hypothetical protein